MNEDGARGKRRYSVEVVIIVRAKSKIICSFLYHSADGAKISVQPGDIYYHSVLTIVRPRCTRDPRRKSN